MSEFIKSERNKAKFSHDGFLYVFDKNSKSNPNIKFWRCELKDQCKARLHTLNDAFLKKVNDHTHGPSAANVQVAVIKTDLKARALSGQENPSTIINTCTSLINQAVQGALPSNDALRQTIRRERGRNNIAPQNPVDTVQLEIPDQYKKYFFNQNDEEDFLIADSGPSTSRILIFGRQSWCRFLIDSDIWYCDGTFKLAPLIFNQVYVIMAKRHDSVHPVLYALLQNKSRETYSRMFQMIKDSIPGVNPISISCDFELAAIQAMTANFPQVQIKACFFHLKHNFFKQVKEKGLYTRYSNESEFSLKTKMIPALAFVPVPNLDEYITALAEILPPELETLLDWFEDNYVGRPPRRGNVRRPPRFAPDMWNLYQRTLSGQDRTNNHAEAAHRKIYIELGVHHPEIWQFINCLRRIQKSRDTYYEQLVAGRAPRQKLKKYIRNDNCILRIVSQFDQREPLEYLRGIAHNYELD